MQAPRNVVVELRSESSAERVATDDKTTGFVGLAYSGGPVSSGFFGDYAIDLTGMDIPDEVSILLNHDPNKIVGRAKIENDGKGLTIKQGTFSAVTPEGQQVAALMGEGHPWRLSIAASGAWQDCERGKLTNVNGRRLALGAVMRKARLLETSFVPAGADPNAYAARLSARYGLDTPKGEAMPADDTPTLEQQLAAEKAKVAQLEADKQAALAAAKTARDAARKQRIESTFGADVEAAELAAYMELSDNAYEAIEKRHKAMLEAAGSDSTLFQRSAKSGDTGDKSKAPAVSLAEFDGLRPDPDRVADFARVEQHAKANKMTFAAAAVALGL